MQTIRVAARYARYLLTSHATVAFGMNANSLPPRLRHEGAPPRHVRH
jgi:hypothetical protein